MLIKYEHYEDSPKIITPCPHNMKNIKYKDMVMVGSYACHKCMHNVSINIDKNEVTCNKNESFEF